MDGAVQTVYPRKNWSSLMLFNCDHPAVRALTPDVVNRESGAYLHRMQWVGRRRHRRAAGRMELARGLEREARAAARRTPCISRAAARGSSSGRTSTTATCGARSATRCCARSGAERRDGGRRRCALSRGARRLRAGPDRGRGCDPAQGARARSRIRRASTRCSGKALTHLGRNEEALASFDRAHRARTGDRQPASAAAPTRWSRSAASTRRSRATTARSRSSRIRSTTGAIAAPCCSISAGTRRRSASFDRAIALAPDFAPAHYNRGNALAALETP